MKLKLNVNTGVTKWIQDVVWAKIPQYLPPPLFLPIPSTLPPSEIISANTV